MAVVDADPSVPAVDAVVVGAGFAGLAAHHALRGIGLTLLGFEAAADVGGTWWWNRYPGARCDVESLEYSYQFDEGLQQEWEWSERFATQPEILRYLDHVADRFELRRDIRYSTRVGAADWDDGAGRWTVTTTDGERATCSFLVMATGCLSTANVPDIPGLASFAGPTLHTGRWPHEGVDLAGARVGVIGTGSSGVQAIPVIAGQASELTVFQRTPTFTVPAVNGPVDPDLLAEVRADYPAYRARNSRAPSATGARFPRGKRSALDATEEERDADFTARWATGGFGFMATYQDLLVSQAANDLAADFVRRKIRELVHDPVTAARLCPDQTIGCKRLCLDDGYYETFNLPHVHLVDLRETPIVEVVPGGVRTSEREHPLDCLVLATGFDAITGTLLRIEVTGRAGRTLRAAWAHGPRTYLGLAVPGLPNLFTITGPGSPSVLTNMVVSIEHHVGWVRDCIAHLRATGATTIEATDAAADEWVHHVNAVAGGTLYPTCDSWYLGANVPGKTRVFMPYVGYPRYVQRCAEVAAAGYEGFALG